MKDNMEEKKLAESEHLYGVKLGKDHLAPLQFTYCLVLDEQSDQFLGHLKKETNTFVGNIKSINGQPFILNGENKINDTDVWVIRHERPGNQYGPCYVMWFKSREEAQNLYDYVMAKLPKPNRVNSIYKYSVEYEGYVATSNYSQRDAVDLIGYTHHIDLIQKDIANYHKYLSFLKSIGEGSRTLNYLLHGPPGTGKTTLIKTLGSENNYPIFIVNPSSMSTTSASELLNPKCVHGGHHPTKLILFEDFDRYLSEGRFNMSEILNELDGIESTEGVVRFFTCNNLEEMQKHDALMNRLSSKFEFFMPTLEHFKSKLDRFLTFHSSEWHTEHADKIAQFLTLVESKCVGKLTLRPFCNYVIRYLFDTDCMDHMIAHIAELV